MNAECNSKRLRLHPNDLEQLSSKLDAPSSKPKLLDEEPKSIKGLQKAIKIHFAEHKSFTIKQREAKDSKNFEDAYNYSQIALKHKRQRDSFAEKMMVKILDPNDLLNTLDLVSGLKFLKICSITYYYFPALPHITRSNVRFRCLL